MAWSEGEVEANGITVHYHRTGSNGQAPLLLLHGITDNGLCWTRVARYLEGTYDVVMPDARGHGRSGGFSGAFSVDTLAEDVAALIRELELPQPAVYGHSMGAVTAASLAARYPDLVGAVVLEDPPFLDGLAAEAASRQTPGQAWQWIEDFKALSPEERLAQAFSRNVGWPEEEITPWVVAKTEFDTAVLDTHPTFHAYPWREVLPAVDSPVLLITGDSDRGAIVTPEVAEESRRLWKRGRVAHIAGAGHSIHRDRFDDTMFAVSSFLSAH